MADVTYFLDHSGSQNNTYRPGIKATSELEVDFAVKNCGSGDRVKIMDVPAGTVVVGVRTVKETLEGGALTVNIGDGTTADLFDAAVNLNTGLDTMEGSNATSEATLFSTGGKYFKAAGSIWATLSAAADTAKALFSVEFYQLNQKY